MLFQGTIPQHVRNIVKETVDKWTCENILIGCSGNFTIERMLAAEFPGRFQIHGCDVSIYTCVLGFFFSKQDRPLHIADINKADWGWLNAYCDTPIGRASTIMLMTDLAMMMSVRDDGSVYVKPTAYHQRMSKAYKRQWSELFESTITRIEGQDLYLASYQARDALEVVSEADANTGVITFPPFYKNGYERLFAVIQALFDFEPPAYSILHDANLEKYIAAVTGRDHWFYGANFEHSQIEDHMCGYVQPTQVAAPVYIYSSDAPTRLVLPKQLNMPVPFPRLMPDEEIGTDIRVMKVHNQMFASLRGAYMNGAAITVANNKSAYNYIVTVDEKIIGCFAYSDKPGPIGDADTLYMISDFPVRPTDYKRLSKLVLLAAVSKEMQLTAERFSKRRMRECVTTAFSDRPISMKYRGVFKLTKRSEGKAKKSAIKVPKFQLQYQATMGQWTLAEALDIWKTKYGTRERI